MSEEKLQQYLRIPLDEDSYIKGMGISRDGRTSGVILDDNQKYRILAILEFGTDEGVSREYELVLADRLNMGCRLPIDEAQFQAIKRMQQDRHGKLIFESMQAKMHQWQKDGKMPDGP